MSMRYPNEFWPAGRPAKTTPLYEIYKQNNAVFGVSDGLEMPLYFAPVNEEPVEIPSFYRSNAFLQVASECHAVRNEAGILDISSYGKYGISGPDAEKWLNKIVASRLPATGCVRLAPLLDVNGRLMGDLTAMRLADDRFRAATGYLNDLHALFMVTLQRNKSDKKSRCIMRVAIQPEFQKILQGVKLTASLT